MGMLAVLTVQDVSRAQGAASSKTKAPATQFEVLSPWAEADPIPLRGISPRMETLAGKKIGLFVNYKRAARPMAESIERRLKAMYPDVQNQLPFYRVECHEIETKNKEKFTAWAKGVDAVIAGRRLRVLHKVPRL